MENTIEKEKPKTTIAKNQKAEIPTKNGSKYSYQYVDIAQIHEHLEAINARYIQQIKRIDNDDYIMTKRCFDGEWEDEWLQGCKVVDATLMGVSNPAQQQGSALTYARRYSLLMAFGLATEDDDGNSLTIKAKEDVSDKEITKEEAESYVFGFGKYKGVQLLYVFEDDEQYLDWLVSNGKADATLKKCIEIVRATSTEGDNKLQLIAEMNRLESDTNSDHEDILKYYEVSSNQEMTIEQLKDCIVTLKKKQAKQNKEVTPYDF